MPFAEQRADNQKTGGGRYMRMFNCLALGAGLLATQLAAPAQAEDAKVAAIVKGLDNPFFQTMQKGIEEQA
jgi:ribose transport system substrate-binding protein